MWCLGLCKLIKLLITPDVLARSLLFFMYARQLKEDIKP